MAVSKLEINQGLLITRVNYILKALSEKQKELNKEGVCDGLVKFISFKLRILVAMSQGKDSQTLVKEAFSTPYFISQLSINRADELINEKNRQRSTIGQQNALSDLDPVLKDFDKIQQLFEGQFKDNDLAAIDATWFNNLTVAGVTASDFQEAVDKFVSPRPNFHYLVYLIDHVVSIIHIQKNDFIVYDPSSGHLPDVIDQTQIGAELARTLKEYTKTKSNEESLGCTIRVLSYDSNLVTIFNQLLETTKIIISKVIDTKLQSTLQQLIFHYEQGRISLLECLEGISKNLTSHSSDQDINTLLQNINTQLSNYPRTDKFLNQTKLNLSMILYANTSHSCNFIHLCCSYGDVGAIRYLPQNTFNAKTPNGSTPISLSCQRLNLLLVEELLKAGATLNKDNALVLIALAKGDLDITKFFVQNNILGINDRDNNNSNLLLIACYTGAIDTVKWLIQNGGATNLETPETIEGYTPFIAACQLDDENQALSILTLLISVSPNMQISQNMLDHTDALGNTLFMHACNKGHSQIVTLLLQTTQFNIDLINKDGDTALHLACQSNHTEVIKSLVQHGASIDAAGKNGDTPLIKICRHGNLDVVDLLANHKTVNMKNNMGEYPVLIVCQLRDTNIALVMLEKLMTYKPGHLDEYDNDGKFLLFNLCQNNRLDLAKVLLEEGAQVNHTTVKGASTLHLVCQMGNLNAVKLLLQYHANINQAASFGITPLILAIVNNQPHIADYLIQNGAKVNLKDDNETSPLLHACQKGLLNTVHLLLENRADITTINQYGETVFTLVCKLENTDQAKQIFDILFSSLNDLSEEQAYELLFHKDVDNFDPIHYTRENGHTDITEQLNQIYRAHTQQMQKKQKISFSLSTKGKGDNMDMGRDNQTPPSSPSLGRSGED